MKSAGLLLFLLHYDFRQAEKPAHFSEILISACISIGRVILYLMDIYCACDACLLRKEFVLNRLFKLMLERRGMTYEDLYEMDNPEHAVLKDCDVLCERLYKARVSNEKIVILPDFDMDGIMSGVVGYAGLSELGFNVELYIPDSKDGYGFNEDVVDKILRLHPGVNIILTCDNGISCVRGVRHAIMRGVTVLVTDHHVEKADTTVLGLAEVVVNPCRIDDDYEHKKICGAYVLWQVLDYYANHYADAHAVDQIARLRVFAGVGTISDMMIMKYENRELVRDAINLCRMCFTGGSWLGIDNSWFVDSLTGSPAYVAAFRGLHYALLGFRDNRSINTVDDIDEVFFGFTLAPTFNSVKRMDEDLADAFGVFMDCTTVDDYTVAKVNNRVKKLIEINERRKVLVHEKFDEIREAGSMYAPYIYFCNASGGLLGLLANQMKGFTGGPCVIVRQLEDGTYTGSGRSPEWYHFVSRVSAAGFAAAGHEAAFGITFKDIYEIQRLYEFLVADINALLSGAIIEEKVCDFEIGQGKDTGVDIPLFIEFLETVERFGPYGEGFERPYIKYTFPRESCQIDTIGKQNQHLRITCERGLRVLCWNQAYAYDDLMQRDMIEVTGNLDINEFNGTRSVQFVGDIVPVKQEELSA